MRALLVAAAVGLAACSGKDGGDAIVSDATTASMSDAVLDGQMLIGDRWVKVVPAVYHDAKMDLATRCLLMRDDAKSKGQQIPLCYDKSDVAVRDRPARTITTIAVERDSNMASAMMRLTSKNEATHFVVDHKGGIYQVLDLAFAPRHGDAYATGEVRVVACDEAGEKAIVAALQALYPNAKVTTSDARPTKGTEP